MPMTIFIFFTQKLMQTNSFTQIYTNYVINSRYYT